MRSPPAAQPTRSVDRWIRSVASAFDSFGTVADRPPLAAAIRPGHILYAHRMRVKGEDDSVYRGTSAVTTFGPVEWDLTGVARLGR